MSAAVSLSALLVGLALLGYRVAVTVVEHYHPPTPPPPPSRYAVQLALAVLLTAGGGVALVTLAPDRRRSVTPPGMALPVDAPDLAVPACAPSHGSLVAPLDGERAYRAQVPQRGDES